MTIFRKTKMVSLNGKTNKNGTLCICNISENETMMVSVVLLLPTFQKIAKRPNRFSSLPCR